MTESMTTETAQIVTRDELMAIDEADIRLLCGEQVFAEAEAIARQGLTSPTRNGLTIEARMSAERGRMMTSQVTFRFPQIDERCDCRYPARFCAHVGALLLLWVRKPGAFAVAGEPQERYALQRNWSQRSEPPSRPVHDPPFELRLLLDSLRVPDLRSLGQRLGLRLRGGAKSGLVDQLVAFLGDKSQVEQLVAGLSPDLRLALAAIYALGGRDGPGQRQLKVALDRLSPTGSDGEVQLAALQDLALVYEPVDAPGSGRCQVPVAYWPQMPTIDVVGPGAEPPGPIEPAGTLGSSLLAIWSSIRAGELRLAARPIALPSVPARAYPALQNPGFVRQEVEALARSGRFAVENQELTIPRRTSLLSDESLRALGARVGGLDAAELVWNLLRDLGLVQLGEVMSAAEGPARELLWAGTRGRLAAVLEAWLRVTGWSELDLALAANPGLRLRRRLKFAPVSYYYDYERLSWSDLDEAVSDGRRFVARVLSLLPVGAWLTTESLLQLIWRIWPDLVYSGEGQAPKGDWWLEVDGRRVNSARFGDWARGPGAVVTALVAGPLHWLGLADLAGPADHPTAFRLRPEARLLRGDNVPEEVTLAPVDLGPDLEVGVATGYPDVELRELLSSAGRLLGTSDRILRYRLVPEGVLSLFDGGRTADDLLAVFERRGGAVPAEARAAIERWWRNYTQLRLAEGITLIELSDEHLLEELLVATSLRSHLIHRFTPRLLAIDPAGADGLFAEMRARGYMPRTEPLEDANRADAADPARSGER